MGLGKTIMTIGALATLQESKNNKGPHMVLAPKVTQTKSQQLSACLHRPDFAGVSS